MEGQISEANVTNILISIENLISVKRKDLDSIKNRYDSVETFGLIKKSNDLMKIYSTCVDDYGKISNIASDISEALMDVRSVNVAMRRISLPVSIEKSIRYNVDKVLEDLKDFRESVSAFRDSLSARLRFYNSCFYIQTDKIFGDKC